MGWVTAAKAAGLDEEIVLESFEKMRGFLIEFMNTLSDTAFENEKVVNQLNMGLVRPYKEHHTLNGSKQ